MPGFIELSTNINCFNKTRQWIKGAPELSENTSWQRYHGFIDDGAVERLMTDYLMAGHAINASPFEGTTRANDYSDGGNVVIIDLDDGIEPDKILATNIYKTTGLFYYPSCSSRVVSTKKGVDGRPRGRVGFRTERSFKTYKELDENGNRPTDKRRNLERIAVTKYIADGLCAELGIPSLEDNCHSAVSQPFYGNSGTGVIEFETKDDNGRIITGTYPCSTDREYHINLEGCLSSVDMDRIVEAYIASKPEILQPRQIKTEEQISRETEIARWILNHDLFSETQLMNRDIAMKSIAATCRTICDSLLEDFVQTMERVDDGHEWRLEHKIREAWYRFQPDYDRSVGTLIVLADEASPGWRSQCPYTNGGGYRRYPVPPLSEAFSLLRSTNPTNIIL